MSGGSLGNDRNSVQIARGRAPEIERESGASCRTASGLARAEFTVLHQNAELFSITYGALVIQLIQDYQDYAQVNVQLDKMYFPLHSVNINHLLNLAPIAPCRGYNIGVRLIEDFLARSNLPKCKDFVETGEIVSKVSSLPLDSTTTLTLRIDAPGRLQVLPLHHPDSRPSSRFRNFAHSCFFAHIRRESAR